MVPLDIPGVREQLTEEQRQCLALLEKLRKRLDRTGYVPEAGSSEIPVCEKLVSRGLFLKEASVYAYTEVCVRLLDGKTNPGMLLGIAPPVPRYVPSQAHTFLTPDQTLLHDATTVFEAFRSHATDANYQFLPKTDRQAVACEALMKQSILKKVPQSGCYRIGAAGKKVQQSGTTIAEVLELVVVQNVDSNGS